MLKIIFTKIITFIKKYHWRKGEYNMKFTCDRDTICEAAGHVSRVVSQKTAGLKLGES